MRPSDRSRREDPGTAVAEPRHIVRAASVECLVLMVVAFKTHVVFASSKRAPNHRNKAIIYQGKNLPDYAVSADTKTQRRKFVTEY
jgi:hypothetical protein